MIEKELQAGVVQVAHLLGYRCHHARAAWTGKGYRTPIQGDKGFVDLVIVGHGRVLFRELKVGRNTLSDEQVGWIRALEEAGADVGVWTEHEWLSGLIETELKRGTRHEAAAA